MGNRRLLLASHGHMASGMLSSLKILAGDVENVTAIDAYVDDSDWTVELDEFLAECAPEDEAVIFTDVQGGSVYQKVCLALAERPDVIHVTGMNLPLVIECLLSGEKLDRPTVAAIAEAAASMLAVTEIQSAAAPASDDDFFA